MAAEIDRCKAAIMQMLVRPGQTSRSSPESATEGNAGGKRAARHSDADVEVESTAFG